MTKTNVTEFILYYFSQLNKIISDTFGHRHTIDILKGLLPTS